MQRAGSFTYSFPFRELTEKFGLKASLLSRKSYFPPEGKIALNVEFGAKVYNI